MRGPLSKSYPADVGLVVFSLVPYLALTAAVFPLTQEILKSTGLSEQTFDVGVALSTAGYAMGTVLAVQFAVHLPPRRMLIGYEGVLLVASVLAAWAPNGAVFLTGYVLQGLATSLLLIAAVPPLVTRWPARRMPGTGAIMNLCVFGAVAAGPTVGAVQATGGSWRWLFWGVAGVACLALVMSLLTYEHQDPMDPDSPWDFVAIGLTVVGSAAAFFGAGWLQSSGVGVVSLVPLVAGAALIVALVVHQFRARNPLMPVKAAATTAPVTGIFVALMASAASFGLIELILQDLQHVTDASHTAMIFIPEIVAAVVIAGVFGIVFKTRFTPVLAIGGLLGIVAAAAVLLAALPDSTVLIAVATGLLGVGVAASVSPGLFMAGFSMHSAQLQRVFAMIELMRGVTAFLVAPVLVYLAGVLGSSQLTGLTTTVWICLGIAAFGFVVALLIFLGGRQGLPTPDLETWQGDGNPAWPSQQLFARLTGRRAGAEDGGSSRQSPDADTVGRHARVS